MARWRDGKREIARWLFLATEYTEYTERFFTKRKREKERKRGFFKQREKEEKRKRDLMENGDTL